MNTAERFEIFLVAPPGLETVLREEALERGFSAPKVVPGGVAFNGRWREVWRANLEMRGAVRVLARVDAFRVAHLAQLDRRARRVAWGAVLRPEIPVRVEAVCRSSRIYHGGAAAERIAKAITETFGAPVSQDAEIAIKARIENDLCTISVDTSGEALHKRGHKLAVNRAPMRETMAALFLRQCGYRGDEPVLDPMCGSGTFTIEAAEIAMGLKPGRARQFAFEHLAGFDADAWSAMKAPSPGRVPDVVFRGSDRDAGAIDMSRENAERAGVGAHTAFAACGVSELRAPDGPPGLVIVNPPYGGRIGERRRLSAVYGVLGRVLMDRFSGWRVGLVTSEAELAKATLLPFVKREAPVDNGGIRVTLYRTGVLG